jgi:hypothetical protein
MKLEAERIDPKSYESNETPVYIPTERSGESATALTRPKLIEIAELDDAPARSENVDPDSNESYLERAIHKT